MQVLPVAGAGYSIYAVQRSVVVAEYKHSSVMYVSHRSFGLFTLSKLADV